MKAKWSAVLLLVSPLAAQVTQPCVQAGKPMTLRGKLVRIDEGGYRQWIGLRLAHPICTLPDPADQFSHGVKKVDLLQMFTIDKPDLDSRLNRLTGHEAVVRGTLEQWDTGYQRALAVYQGEDVQAIDPAGEAALRAHEPPKPIIRDVAAYYVTVEAGKRLRKEARETGTNQLLVPADEYAPHNVTGGEVVYVHCREDYTAEFVSGSMTAEDALCMEGFCGFGVPERGTITLKMRCTRDRNP